MISSKFVSEQCLESACSQIMHLAKCLQHPADRIALFTTVCRHEPDSQQSSGACQLYPLGSPRLEALERELQLILEPSRHTMLSNPSFPEALVAAQNALVLADERYDRTSGRSIVIFTPIPTVVSDVLHITPLRIHIICPGAVSFTSTFGERLNGWLLDTGSMTVPATFTERFNRLESHLRNIDSLISSERRMCNIGEIANLFLYIKAGAGASIEQVIGDLWYRALHPGQTISLMVKVKVKPIIASDDPFTSVELMMGEVLSDLLQIELVHEHSLFPGSDISTRITCWLLRHNDNIDDHTPYERLRNERRSSWIRSHLAYQQACIRPHRDALNRIEKSLRRNDFRHCHGYLRMLRDELAFQVGVAADDFLFEYLEKNDADSPATIIHRKM